MNDEDMVVVPVGQTVTIDLPAGEHWWVSTELMPDGSTRHERADGRVIVVRPAPTETIDGTAAEYPGTLTAEARAERAEAQLAALRVAARETLIAYGGEGDPLGAALEAALDDGAQAAEAHDRRVRSEALREAAGTGRRAISAAWLRARADETERGDG